MGRRTGRRFGPVLARLGPKEGGATMRVTYAPSTAHLAGRSVSGLGEATKDSGVAGTGIPAWAAGLAGGLLIGWVAFRKKKGKG